MWERTLDESKSVRIQKSKRSNNADPTDTLQPRSNIADRLKESTTKSRLERSDRTQINEYHDLDEFEEDSLHLTSNSQPNIALAPVVQISQHSSFDRGQYLQYHSSVSVYSLFSSAPPHADSGLGESSPPPEALESSKSEFEGIVPDSQSLQGSSSYRPTASTTEDTSRLHQHDHRNLSIHCSFDSIGEPLENSDLFETLGDPIEDSSGKNIYVAESPESRFWSQRSSSVPVQGVAVTSSSNSSSGGLLACLTRSTSDPSPLVYGTPESILDTLPGHPNHRQRVCVFRAFFSLYRPPPCLRPRLPDLENTDSGIFNSWLPDIKEAALFSILRTTKKSTVNAAAQVVQGPLPSQKTQSQIASRLKPQKVQL